MSYPPQAKDSVNKDGYSAEHILTGWLEAIARFYQFYNQLNTHVSQHVAEQDLRNGSKIDMGQCPVGQLLMMVTRMQGELEKLAQDMDQGERLTKLSARKNYEKLATHTLRLNQLSDQAKLRLDLCTSSVS